MTTAYGALARYKLGVYAITLIIKNKTKGIRDRGRVLLERKK
ncbi:hypothetical protein [Anaplasma phagocytophilum]|nr:hypothetical protein [Anaplasma phagocytophilum]